MPTWDVGRGTTKESYEAGRTGDHRTRGRQDQMGSGYWDRPANRQVLQDQQARIKKMQRDRTGIFASGRATQPKQGFLSGIGQKFKDWAGNMRGGINPLTNEYYTQDEYEQNRANRIAQKRIQNIQDREAPWTEQTLTNLGNLGYQGDLSRSQIGTTPFERYPPREGTIVEDYQKGLGGTEVADEMMAPEGYDIDMMRQMINNAKSKNVTSLPVDEGINRYTAEADAYLPGLKPIDTMNNPTWNPITQQFEYNMGATSRVDDGISNLFAAEQLHLPGMGPYDKPGLPSGYPWSMQGEGASPNSWITKAARGGIIGIF